MIGIDKITNRILSDAQKNAQIAVDEAKREEAMILTRAEEQASKKEADILRTAHEQAAQLEKRMVSVGELEARKLRLSAKQEAVENCFETALDRLSNLGPETYIDLLAAMVCGSLKGDAEIILNAKDKDEIGSRLIDEINSRIERLETKEVQYRVDLSNETIDACGGFILRCGQVEINFRLETLVKSLREELVPKVAAVLFD